MGAEGGRSKFQKFILIDFLAKLGRSKHFSFFFHFLVRTEWGPRGGGQNFQNLFLIDFLAKLANSKHFSFFSHFFGVDRVGVVKI